MVSLKVCANFLFHLLNILYTVDLVMFACSDCLDFWCFGGFFARSRIHQLSILMIGSAIIILTDIKYK